LAASDVAGKVKAIGMVASKPRIKVEVVKRLVSFLRKDANPVPPHSTSCRTKPQNHQKSAESDFPVGFLPFGTSWISVKQG
jgi:hypothetical protein